MTEQEALLATIRENPNDETPQRVYADWLEENGMPQQAEWWRKVQKVTGKEFKESIIAQDDDGDYRESGYVACVFKRGDERFACLFHYSHCSCYDTWASICGGGISNYPEENEIMEPAWDWLGSVEELVEKAKNDMDPTLGWRKNDDRDDDVDHLREAYRQILEWHEKDS